MKLTANFTLEELTASATAARHGWDNTPDEKTIENLKRLAQLLQQVKSATGGRAVIVTSGYRSKQLNDAVGSTDASQHRIGCAADIKVAGMTPREVFKACIEAKLPYDQIILEYESWVHISVPNTPIAPIRHSRLIIDKQGTRPYVRG